MAGSVSDYIKKRLKEIDGIGGKKSDRISIYFETINDFKNANYLVFQNIQYFHNGITKTVPINNEQLDKIKLIQNNINENDSLIILYADLVIREFLNNIQKNIADLSLDNINCNPFLGAALKLSENPEKFFKFNAWSSIQRSIVTSFGSTVEKLLLYCNSDIEKGSSPDGGEKWDLLKNINGINHWLEIKSGTNDMDKTQVERYKNKMERAEERGDVALFGFSYGRIERSTVTLGLLSSYIENWEQKVKIGGDLWDFLSGQDQYADTLMILITQISNQAFGNQDVIDLIDLKTEQIISEFENNYENLEDYLSEQY